MNQVMHIWLSGAGGAGKTMFGYGAIEPFAKENGWTVLFVEEDGKCKISEERIDIICKTHEKVLVIHETLRTVGILPEAAK